MGTRGLAITVVAAVALVACGREEPPPIAPPPAATGSPIELPDPPTPSVDPEAQSGFTVGAASVTLTGALNLTETYPRLGLPAVWVPPPGEIAMTWGSEARSISIVGTSFTSAQPTASDRVLTFSVRGDAGPIVFTSSDGSCSVTISPALPDRMGGTFLCASIPGDPGDGTTVTVAAQGTFSAE